MSIVNTPFTAYIASYIALQRKLGLQFRRQGEVLSAFDRYVRQRDYRGPLTQELALAYATHNRKISTNETAYRYQFVRRFADYLVVFEPRTPRLDPKALRKSSGQPPRHIYTEDELSRLLREARAISPHPIRGLTLLTIVGLAASTGLRVSEVVALDEGDVDLESGVIIVRKTKFKKQRLIVVHATTRRALRRYVSARDTAYPGCSCPAFFINMRGRRFARHTICDSFRKLAVQAGLRGPKGNGPSFHSLRHTFAVGRLGSWYKANVDVQAMLPALATYMGHAHYTDTAYYITATAELMNLAASRYYRGQRVQR